MSIYTVLSKTFLSVLCYMLSNSTEQCFPELVHCEIFTHIFSTSFTVQGFLPLVSAHNHVDIHYKLGHTARIYLLFLLPELRLDHVDKLGTLAHKWGTV